MSATRDTGETDPASIGAERPVSGGQILSRAGFFNDWWEALEGRGWDAVILHGWQKLPEQIDSDVDYTVSGPAPSELLGFLSEFCRKRGWLLVQVIEHEPDAYYCVCMQAGGSYDWLALDVTWNYRRIGHVLLSSDLLVDRSRRIPGKSFRVPSVGGEFVYIIAKAAAKGKEFSSVRDRLSDLLSEDSAECCAIADRAFGGGFPQGGRGQDHVAVVADWFATAPCFAALRAGRRFGIGEIALYLRRVLNPTGFWLVVESGEREHGPGTELVKLFEPLFRHIYQCPGAGMPGLPGILRRLVRTTLVVEVRRRGGMIVDRVRRSCGITIDPAREGAALVILERLAERVDARIARRGRRHNGSS